MSSTAPITPAFSGPEGLVTAVAQDAATGEVLMVAHMNREAWDETLASGRAVYFSRARKRLWRKGEESGNVQNVEAIYVDCDADTVLLKVEQIGGAALIAVREIARIQKQAIGGAKWGWTKFLEQLETTGEKA